MLAFFRGFSGSRSLTPEIYVELVRLLFRGRYPTIVFIAVLILVGAVLWFESGDSVTIGLVVAAMLCSLARLLVLRAFGQTASDLTLDEPMARSWEHRYATCSILMALATGAIGARCFLCSDILVHMFAAGLMCGCGAGVVTRLSVRPWLATASLCCICIPPTAAAFLNPDIVHFGLGILFLSFLLGSVEAIQYLFSTTVDQLILKQKFSRLAHRDPLTNLFNRLMLSENIEIALKNLQAEQTKLALHIVDLDYFKAANDTFGHLAGDAILKAVAERLTDLARNGDIVARIGGDEFVFVQVGIHHEEEAEMLARRIVRSISAPYLIGDQELRIGASIGIAIAPLHGLALEQLLGRADEALYRSKQTRNRFTFASLQPLIERVAAG